MKNGTVPTGIVWIPDPFLLGTMTLSLAFLSTGESFLFLHLANGSGTIGEVRLFLLRNFFIAQVYEFDFCF